MKLKKSVKDIQQSGTSEFSSSPTSMVIDKDKDKNIQQRRSDANEFKFKFIIAHQQDNRWVQILELLLSLSLTSTGQVFGFSVAAFFCFFTFLKFPTSLSLVQRNRCVTCAQIHHHYLSTGAAQHSLHFQLRLTHHVTLFKTATDELSSRVSSSLSSN